MLGRSFESLALGAVFVAAASAGLVQHGGIGASRRLAATITNHLLGGLFVGRVELHDIQRLEIQTETHVRVGEVEVFDPNGRRALLAKGVELGLSLPRLLTSLPSGIPDVAISNVTIDEAEVVLDVDEEGKIGIAEAFAPPPSPDAGASPSAPREEYVRLSIPRAKIRHAWVHGNLVPPALDADASDVRATIEVAGNVLRVTDVEGRADVRSPHAPSQNGTISGAVTGYMNLPLDTAALDAAGLDTRWRLVGDVGGVPTTASFTMEGDRVDGEIHVPVVSAETFTTAFPSVPLKRPIELHARLEGRLPVLAMTARARIEEGEVTARGELDTTGDLPFRFDADVLHADASAFGGPKTRGDARVHVEGTLDGAPKDGQREGPRGTFRAATKETSVSDTSLPPMTVTGAFDPSQITLKGSAAEPGVSLDTDARLDVDTKLLVVDATAKSSQIARIPGAPAGIRGSATARANATMDLARGTLSSRVVVDGQGVAYGSIVARRVHAVAVVSGNVERPVATLSAQAVNVEVRDGDKEPLSYASVTGHASIALATSPARLDNVELHLEPKEGGPPVVATASSVGVGAGGFEVKGARVTGLGAPLEIDARALPGGAVSLRARGSGLDLERAAVITGIDELRLLPEGTRATLDLDVTRSSARANGHASLAVAAPDGSRAELSVELEGRRARVHAHGEVPGLGWVELSRAELELPGALDRASIERATGSLDLRAEIDIARAATILGVVDGEGAPAASGVLTVSAHAERGDGTRAPTLRATATTRGLVATVGGSGAQAKRVTDVDGSVHVSHDGATDETVVSAVTWDRRGALASAEVKARVPLAGWLKGTSAFSREAIGKLEIAAAAHVHRRSLGAFPAPLARSDLSGHIAAHAEATGTIAHPQVEAVVELADVTHGRGGRGGRGRGARQGRRGANQYAPVDGSLRVRWDGRRVMASLSLDEEERRRPGAPRAGANGGASAAQKPGRVRALVLADIRADDLVAGRDPQWNASAELDVSDLELAPIPMPLSPRGLVTGRVKLRNLNGNPSIVAQGTVEGLSVGGAAVEKTHVDLRAADGSFVVSAKIEQEDGGSGTVHATSTGLEWRGLDLEWDETQRTRIDYVVDRFRLGILRPLVRDAIPEIDGRIDGRGDVAIESGVPTFDGGLSLTGGRAYVNALGEEITDVEASAQFDERGSFRIPRVTGRAGAGEFTASADGRMKGLRFEEANAVVVIPSKEGIPLSSEAATFAEATGELQLNAKMSEDRSTLLVTATIPRSRVEIPERSTQTLQSLDPDETITVGVRDARGALTTIALVPPVRGRTTEESEPPLRTQVAVTLGDDVFLEGRGLRVYLTGRTLVDIAEEVAVSGQIALKQGGTIDVQGRKFVVDFGTVTFDGEDASNPTVVAAASWDAPDRTKIWVEFSGPLKTGNLTLRSEPPYSKNEILSILLFGRPDPNMGTGGDARPSSAEQAGSVGAGFASAGLNRALGELSDDIDLEQDRTSANRIRTKVGYRIRQNLKVQLGYAAGVSQREPDTTYLFIEWQFIPKWAVIGTRGDRGTSILDVLFQHRY